MGVEFLAEKSVCMSYETLTKNITQYEYRLFKNKVFLATKVYNFTSFSMFS